MRCELLYDEDGSIRLRVWGESATEAIALQSFLETLKPKLDLEAVHRIEWTASGDVESSYLDLACKLHK